MGKIGGLACGCLFLILSIGPAQAWLEKPAIPPPLATNQSSPPLKPSYIEIGQRSGDPARLSQSPLESGRDSGVRLASMSSALPNLITADYSNIQGSVIPGDYVFKSGQTYFVRGPVTMTGKVTIQGGAVIKYDEASTGAGLTLLDAEFATSSVDWAVFTSKNDDTIGEKILNSSGTPGFPDYGTALTLNGGSARFIQIRYADRAIAYDGSGGNLSLRNAEFYGVGTPLYASASSVPAAVELANVLTAFSKQGPVIDDRGLQAVTVTAHNLSFYLITGAAFDAHLTASGSSLLVFDSLFDYVLGGSTFSGTAIEHHNAFYRSPAGTGAHDLVLASDPMLADWFLDQTSPVIDGGSRLATTAGLYSYTTNKNLAIEATTQVDIGYHHQQTARGFSILAMDGVQLKESAVVASGDVGVINAPTTPCKGEKPCRGKDRNSHDDNENDWALTLGERARTPGGFSLFADSLRIRKHAVAGGKVYYNDLNNKGSIVGSQFTPLPLPLFEVLPVFKSAVFSAPAPDVKVKKAIVLSPGDYRDIIVGEKASLVFQGGVYNIRSLRVGERASVTFRGLAELRIQNDFKAGHNATVSSASGMNLSASDIMFHVAGGQGSAHENDVSVDIGENSTVVGHFYAPYGTIRLKERADVYGILLGKQVVVGHAAKVTLDTRAAQQTVASSPEIMPHGGTFWDSAKVELFTITSGATIYYTLDGSTPSRSATLYTGPFTLSPSEPGGTTVKAVAVRDGYLDSAVSTAIFLVKPRPTTEAVTMSPVSGAYWDSVIVSLASATTGVSIYYTLDGSTPTRGSTLYSAPITLTSNAVITAIAIYPEYHDSRVSSATYTVRPRPTTAAVTMSPAPGMYRQSVIVTLASVTSGASIYYTLDGSTPTRSSTLYSTPITLTSTTTISAFAVYPEYQDSGVSSATYTIQSIPVLQTGAPDLAQVAPSLSTALSADIASGTSFLYSGANAVQTGVQPGVIESKRAAVLRGQVLARSGAPLPGATISILGHPEFGSTVSRANGLYDMAVNGGGTLVVTYAMQGYISAQRQVSVPWQDFALVDDVALVPLDANVTAVDLASATTVQVAQGSPVTDADGTRQATMMFAPGTTAEMVLPDGTTQALSNLAVRATEFTTGSSGHVAMPAQLPPSSAYTYAVDLSVDAAISAGATTVNFSNPVPVYVENFLNFPVGEPVPNGFYDPKRGIWVADKSGLVIKILGIANGLVDVDVTGGGTPATATALAALGMDDGERARLAALYSPGQTLWRVPVTHFSPRDFNWSAIPGGAVAPTNPPAIPMIPPANCTVCQGSAIQVEGRIMGESIPVAGTPFTLNYNSDRIPGNKNAYKLKIPLIGADVRPSIVQIELIIDVAGRRLIKTFDAPIAPNLNYDFEWDRLDAYGRDAPGVKQAKITIRYIYTNEYRSTTAFGAPGSGPVIGGARRPYPIAQEYTVPIGAASARPLGLGGWTLNANHIYDPFGNILHLGDGSRRSSKDMNNIITTIDSGLFNPHGLMVDDKGDLYFGDMSAFFKTPGRTQIVGTWGWWGGGFSGDGGPAISARLACPPKIAKDRIGNLFIADSCNARIRKVDTNSIITTVAGNGVWDNAGDGGPATQAAIAPLGLAVDQAGNIYIASGPRVRKVDTSGIISTFAGGEPERPFNGDGIPATQANLNSVLKVAVDNKGNVYLYEQGDFNWSTRTSAPRVRKVSPDGIINTVVGNGSESAVDGIPATQSGLSPNIGDLIVDGQGNIYLADVSKILKVGTDGIINTIAGTGVSGFNGDKIPARSANMNINGGGIAVSPDGSIFVGDEHSLRKISTPLPGFSNDGYLIPSEDGAELYVFDSSGRHLQTKSTLTNTAIYDFAYDTAGRLDSVTDGNGNITTVQRDTSGNVTGVVSPDSLVTSLTLNTGGYLASAINPNGETTAFAYTADGLMAARTDARGNATTFVFDANGLLTKDIDAAGGSQSLARIDVNNQKYSVTNTSAMNRISSYSVETLLSGGKNLRTTVDPSGLTTATLLGLDDSQTITDPDGTVTKTTKTPDPRWGMQAALSSATVTTPSGLVSNLAANRAVTMANPDDLFSLTTQTDRLNHNGNVFTTVFDAIGLKYTSTTAEGRQSTSFIDRQGHLLKRQFGALEPTLFAYDARGRMTTITSGALAQARVSSIAYNPEGYVARIIDPMNHITEFTYDLAGRATQKTLPDGRVVAYAYDANGNLTSITPPTRPAHLFAYNAVDMESGYTPPALTGLPTTTTQYAYNLDKQLTTVTRPDGQAINFNYDTGGRLSRLDLSGGASIGYQYSATTGKLITITSGQAPALPPSGSSVTLDYDGFLPLSSTWSGSVAGSVSKTYDNNFRVVTMSVNGANTVVLTYDRDSLLINAGAESLGYNANGQLTGTALSTITDSYAYNGFGEVTGYTANTGTLPVYSAQFNHDALGRVAQKTETVETATINYGYSYDTAGRLTAVSRGGVPYSSYQYDANGNRLGKTVLLNTVNGTYDAQDRLTNYNGTTYAYTANGELTNKVSSSGTTSYTYDVLGNLTAVTLPNGTAISYLIDGMNRRIGKKVNATLVKGWLYDGIRPVAELDGASAVVATFVYASKGNVPDFMVKGGNTYRIISDHLGSPKLVVDSASGAIAQQIDYDEYGIIANDTNPGFQPFGFAGGLYDSDTKLTRFGARDYDAETGRWTAKDPIRFSGGDTNLYGYVLNDPVNLIDSTGYAVDTFADLAFISYDLYRLAKDNLFGKCGNLAENSTALGADIAGALIPGVTGLGLGIRSASKEIHHLLPKQFKNKFEKVGLDIDKYTIELTQTEHRFLPDGLHTGSNSWNKQWKTFFKDNPLYTKQDVLNQLNKMMKQYGL